MKTAIIDAFARAFGVVIFIVMFLWIGRRAFPSNWVALVSTYLACVPLAALYGWLVGPQSDQVAHSAKRGVSGLLVIGITVAMAIVAYMLFQAKIDGIFFGEAP